MSTEEYISSEDDVTVVQPKSCRVCNDKANGYNYNVVTCESCKAFFRRNATKQLSCPRRNSCAISVLSRRACPKCRQQKCFRVGMQLNAKCKMGTKSLCRPQMRRSSSSGYASKGEEVPLVERLLSAPSSASYNYRPRGSIALQMYSYCQCSCACKGMATKLPGIVDSALQTALVDSMSPLAMAFAPSPPTNAAMAFIDNRVDEQFGLTVITNEDEGEREGKDDSVLNEIRIAGSCMATAMTDEELAVEADFVAQNKPEKDAVYFIKVMDLSIRRMIELAKSLSAFRQLCQEEQTQLLKGSVMELFILHGAMTFDAEEGLWRCPSDPLVTSIKTDVLKKFAGNLYDKYMAFMATFDPEMLADHTLIYILMVITLFKPRNSSSSSNVVAQHNAYKALLQRYIGEHYSPRAQCIYVYNALMGKLEEMESMNVETLNFFIALGYDEIGPLLVEIFDLK